MTGNLYPSTAYGTMSISSISQYKEDNQRFQKLFDSIWEGKQIDNNYQELCQLCLDRYKYHCKLAYEGQFWSNIWGYLLILLAVLSFFLATLSPNNLIPLFDSSFSGIFWAVSGVSLSLISVFKFADNHEKYGRSLIELYDWAYIFLLTLLEIINYKNKIENQNFYKELNIFLKNENDKLSNIGETMLNNTVPSSKNIPFYNQIIKNNNLQDNGKDSDSDIKNKN